MKTLFTGNWKFKEFELNTGFDIMNADDSLVSVDIPHDWMIWHTKDLYKNSIGFYKKTFNFKPVLGHSYFIRFEGVYMDSCIYFNGAKIYEWKYGYSTFDVNVTDYLVDGENTIAVSCTYQSPNSRWYSGAGIYRNVYFIEKEATYINNDGVYISTAKAEDDFNVTVDTECITKDAAEAEIVHTLLDADSKVVNKEKFVVAFKKGFNKSTQSFSVKTPKLWDIKSPYLYSLETTVSVDGKVMDVVNNPVGFRTISFDPNNGFFLNGRNVKINGACQHHDLGALGAAVNKTALRRQIEALIKMGVNSIRTSHNMPAKELVELADELGMLIYSESFDMWELPKTEFDYARFFPEWYETDVTSWIRRDYNHPSIIIWGIGNEIYDTHGGDGLKWTRLLRDKVREIDYRHNAYIGIGSNYIEWENAQKCSDLLELSGYNYGERLYDMHHEKYPNWVIFGSETGSTVQSRGIYHFPYEKSLLTYEDGQCSSLGNCTTNWGAKNADFIISEHRDRDFVFGQYIWTGWDYIGEPTPYFTKNSFFGQIDTAGFKKDAFYHYQAEWTDYKENPMVHLLPYWDFNEGQIIDVCAYSNAPYVELFFNGESLGKKFIDHKNAKLLQAQWKLPYSKGELKAVATDEDGNIIATDIQSSFEDPKKVVLSADKTALSDDPQDLIFVEISTVDKDGKFVANARNRINVSVKGEGKLVGLDNGDSTDYEEYKGTSRKLFSGKLLAIIAGTKNAGKITVTAESKDLETATVVLDNAEKTKEGAYILGNFESEIKDDIPVRKIEMTALGSQHLDEKVTETSVKIKVFPENATYNDIIVKALTPDAVEANFVEVTFENNVANIKALGDGEFRLTAVCRNGSDLSEVISELEFDITGLGQATYNPYEFVHGCNISKALAVATKLSFDGGIFVQSNETSYVTYDNVDFGEFGSDEVTLPVFSFHDSVDIEIISGNYEDGENLGQYTYYAKSIYNTYQENTFKLPKKIKGTTAVTFVFHITDRFSLKGFSFTKLNKAYSVIYATEASRITGDSFTKTEDAIVNIGNNVSIDFDNMNFADGVKSITICGCSHNEKTSIHLLFIKDGQDTRQMIEIPYSEDYEEYTIPLESVTMDGQVSMVFLPGSNFDLKYFKFS